MFNQIRSIGFKLFVSVIFIGLQVSQSAFAQGCSQCKLLAEQGSGLDESSFGTNINSGILYLMAIPYLILLFLFRKRIIRFFKRSFTKQNG
jgi:hypothetical protein